MKIHKLLFIGLIALNFSCSKDDPEPRLEEQQMSLLENQAVITAPPAMQNSQDEHAQIAASYIAMANGMSTYLTYLQPPDDAVKSEAEITASNGRVAATGDRVTYIWTDAATGYSVAYQAKEEADRYRFEVFFKEPGQDWLKYVDAWEKKDRSEGQMKVYDIFFGDPSTVWLTYTWKRDGDIFTFKLEDNTDNFYVFLTVNTKTKAGSVKYVLNNKPLYEMEWDAQGNGSWKFYDDEGNIEESGEWMV